MCKLISFCIKNLIEIIDSDKEKTEEQELVEDMISIITVFSARINGRKSHIKKKLMENLNALREESKN